MIYKVPRKHTFYELQSNPFLGFRELLKYVFTGKGLFLAAYVQIAIFARSALLSDTSNTEGTPDEMDPAKPANIPDIEIQPIPYGSQDSKIEKELDKKLRKDDGKATLLVQLLRPKSSGAVKLRNRNPRERPKCEMNFLGNAEDLSILRRGVRLAAALAKEMKAGGYMLEELDTPPEDEEGMNQWIKDRALSTFHYSSTCRMAPREEGGVVDDELRVHGIQGLRIADASIFPTIPACHLQAPVVMVGERCAEFILRQ